MDDVARAAAEAAADLAARGMKECLGADCREEIPADAKTCPWCRRRQTSVASGINSGAARRAARFGR